MSDKPTRSPYNRFLAARAERLRTGKEPLELSNEIRQCLIDALNENAQGIQGLPSEMAKELADALAGIDAGHLCPLLTPKRAGRGTPGRTPTEVSCIEDAVRYRRAVEKGLIKDPRPIFTIQEAFGGDDEMTGGIDRSTIQKWFRDPAFRGISVEDENPELITTMLRFSGRHYSENFSKAARGRSK